MMGVFDSDKGLPRPRFLDDDYVRKERRRKSMKQEDRVAAEVGGHRVPGSGAFKSQRGDVNATDFLMEAKRTDGKVLTVRMDWLAKIREEAAAVQKLPALTLEFGDWGHNVERDWVMVPLSVFKRLTGGGA